MKGVSLKSDQRSDMLFCILQWEANAMFGYCIIGCQMANFDINIGILITGGYHEVEYVSMQVGIVTK